MLTVEERDRLAGRYDIGTLLGRGGMGEVHAAYDRRLHRTVAIKTLRSDVADQARLVRRFEEEGRIAARLSHPHAVAVFDVGEDDGMPYLVMEYVEGTTLAADIARGPLEPGRAVRIGLQILGALGAAHAAGIVHRDVKPANVILTGDDTAKVTDFGIAKMSGEDLTATLDGATGGVLGTAAYIAPERLHGEPATARSDLYALGAVLYEALCGEAPFRADTPGGLVWAVTSGHRVPLGERRPDLPPALSEVVDTAMAARPEDRFPDAGAMAAALETAMTPAVAATKRPDAAPTVPVSVAPATEIVSVLPATDMLPPGPVAPARRRRGPVVAAGVVAGVVLALLALALGGDRTSDDVGGGVVAGSANAADGSFAGELRDAINALDEPSLAPPVTVSEPADAGGSSQPGKGKGKKKD